MSQVTDATTAILQKNSGAPFLFVGSGFSRRYLGLEDWSGMLQRFCGEIQEYDYYLSSANSDLPKTASLIAADFHKVWWKSDAYAESRKRFKDGKKTIDAALKNEVSAYLSDLQAGAIEDAAIQKELSALRKINVDGIITTNWDLLLEDLFPEYRTYIGQEELLFSNPQAIADIYKIHGCASDPSSLVLTAEDYAEFQQKNPYLAAKLITIFIEHPIFFIGYSVSDPHIQSIIFSIASCLNGEKLAAFSDNLIFVRRSNGKEGSVQKVTFSSDGRSVSSTVLETDDFCEVYSAIEATKRKIPARILRYCKEQMYELVKSAEPEKKIAVLDIDELDASDEVEFVVGVGVAKGHLEAQEAIATEGEKTLSKNGYKGVAIADLFEDFLKEHSRFDAEILLRVAFPLYAKSNAAFIPIYRYLRSVGINSAKDLENSDLEAAKEIVGRIKVRGYQVKTYRSQYDAKWKDRSTAKIIASVDPEKVALFIPFQAPNAVDHAELKNFLQGRRPSDFRDPYSSFFKKLACYYDWLAFGF